MKKFLTMLLALVMVLSLAACSSQKGGDVNGGFPVSAVDLLTAVWNAYPESEKFSVVGGSLDNPHESLLLFFPDRQRHVSGHLFEKSASASLTIHEEIGTYPVYNH